MSLIFFELNSPEYLSMEWMMEDDLLWLRILPLLWALGAIIALILGCILFSRTDRGYRISPFLILALLCWGSLLGGGFLYASGFIHIGEREMRRFEPRYDTFRNRFQKILRPEDGQLLLRIGQNDGNMWKWKSLDGRIWQVTLQCSTPDCEKRISNIQFKWPPTLFLWKITSENVFEASDVRLPPRNPADKRKFREEFRSGISGEVYNARNN